MQASTGTSMFRKLLTASLAMSAFFILGTASVSADAVGVGATFTSDANVSVATGATAGDAVVFTVSDANVAQITTANEIRISLNTAYSAHWNAADTTAVIGGAVGKVSTAVTIEGANNNVLVLNVTGNFANNESVTISGLSIIGDSFQGATAMTWSTDGGASYAAGNPTLAVSVTDAAGTVTLSNPAVGATQSTTIAFTLSVQLRTGDTVVFTLPAEIDVDGFGPRASTGSLAGGGGTVDCSAAGQTVTCTINGTPSLAAGARTIISIFQTGNDT